MGAIKEHSNQIIKVLICLCLTFVFIFVQPKENVQQAEAIAPLLAWGAWAIAGIVAEEVIEMGVRHVTSDGKVKTKSKTKKIADEIFSEYGAYGFDFLKTNPTRKADGSLVFNPSANDRAKIARKIADEFADVVGDGVTSNEGTYDGMTIDWTSSNTQKGIDTKNFVEYMFHVDTEDSLVNLGNKDLYLTSKVTGKKTLIRDYPSGTSDTPVVYQFLVKDNSYPFSTGRPYTPYDRIGCTTIEKYPYFNSPEICDMPTQTVYINMIDIIQEISGDGGIFVPNTMADVYPAPPNMSPSTVLPNRNELSNKPVVLKNIYPVSSDDSEITYEQINNDYETDNSISNKFEQNVDTYLENGDLNQNTYNTQTINNYYTDSQYPTKSGDVTIIIDNEVVVPPDDDGDLVADGFKYCVEKSSGKIVPCKDIEAIDGGLLSYVRNSYDYAVNAVKTAVNGLETIATGSVGLIALYSEIFDWLPDEVTVLLTSGLMLMIGLRVFRK